jgi:hypothetical protein
MMNRKFFPILENVDVLSIFFHTKAAKISACWLHGTSQQ